VIAFALWAGLLLVSRTPRVIDPAVVSDARARASGVPTVAVDVTECGTLDGVSFMKILRIELGTSWQLALEPSVDAHVQVELLCTGDSVAITLTQRNSLKALERTIYIGSVPMQMRARLVALSVAELVGSSAIELAAPAPQATSLVEKRMPAPPLVRPRAGWQLGGAFVVRGMWRVPAPQFGGQLRLLHHPHRHIAWTIDVDATHGIVSVGLGDVALTTISGAIAVVGWGEVGPLALHVGLGVRAGTIRMVGRPDDPTRTRGTTLVSAWGGPLSLLRAAIPIHRHVRIGLSFELGIAAFAAIGRADGTALVDSGLAWSSGALELLAAF